MRPSLGLLSHISVRQEPRHGPPACEHDQAQYVLLLDARRGPHALVLGPWQVLCGVGIDVDTILIRSALRGCADSEAVEIPAYAARDAQHRCVRGGDGPWQG